MIKIFTDKDLPRTISVQYRFPRSKRKRIRKKWARKVKNYHDVPAIFAMADGLWVHPDYVEKIRKRIEEAA